jgi:hypothetical protein
LLRHSLGIDWRWRACLEQSRSERKPVTLLIAGLYGGGASLPLMTSNDFPIPPSSDEEPATPESTREDLLGSQRRYGPPIRHAFIQEYGNDRRPGPLHRFVEERRLLALQLYLFFHCLPLAAPWDANLPAATWARALNKVNAGAEGTISRSWAWLAANDLVRIDYLNRKVRPYLLNEDGSAADYTRSKSFFYFPLDYFRKNWHAELRLPATAVLLIGLSRARKSANAPWFDLKTEVHSGWYGISADTLQRGLDELRAAELLQVHPRKVRDNKARYGTTMVNEYLLVGDLAARATNSMSASDDEDA